MILKIKVSLSTNEPDAALDLPGKAEIRKYLGMYKQMGGTILIATAPAERFTPQSTRFFPYELII